MQVKKGIKIIKKLEKKDVAKTQDEIDSIQNNSNDTQNNKDDSNFSSKFSDSIILGDSRAQSLYEYEILDNSCVIAYKGRNVITAQKSGDIKKAINLAPKNIFLTYGLNDIQNFTNSKNFIDEYSKIIKKIKKESPKTKIYVNSILEVNNKGLHNVPKCKNIPQFNNAIKKMCKTLKVTYIDLSPLFNENDFDIDGVHFKPDLNKKWLNLLIEKADL